MSSKMLIDASHPEETRVVVLKGNRVEEFDFESATKKQLRGNIYLAKVTRVEPSLQAAFVEYGGNRHGFLAFSEIHPDYYQIPFADRQALLEEEARAHRDEEDESRGNERAERGARGGERSERGEKSERSDRGDRNHRRSRRHRRDGAVSALERRGPTDDSVSEPAFEIAPSIEDDRPEGVDRGTSRDFEDAPDAIDASPEDRTGSKDEPDHDDADPEQPELGLTVPDEASSASMVAETETPVVSSDAAADREVAAQDHVDAVPEQTVLHLEPAEAQVAVDEGSVTDVDTAEAAAAEMDPLTSESTDDPVGSTDLDHGAPEAAFSLDAASLDVQARDIDGDEARAVEHEDEVVEQIGGDALEDVAPRPARLRRHYKIQEVIKRRQILLIQVVKEERGNKGAALTTYLSLAGRYSVLMPNTARGGGISRKITDGEDRKRLKAIAQDLDVPEGMGVILRTAGAARSKIEVRRDFEYLLRMWESVRELTLKSTAPTLVYEEGSLIKRSIRDLYGSEVEEIVVAGADGFGEARDFMRMLMPGNTNSVQLYRDPQPIFAKSGVEAQLDAMFSNHVTLRSGGYLVINQTEALVAIDVNSGRSTREHNIEDTALRTNLEAADEVARQLRLRDLAGLIVVDFIDMEESRNNRAVERRIKEALKHDRARIQIGRISHFGLLEMSRQRIRTGVLEGSTVICSHCAGAGTVRSTASIALHVLRLLEDALIKDASYDLIVRSRSEVALYVLNQKRIKLVELEQRFGVTLSVLADPSLTGMIYHAIERGEPATLPMAPAPRQDLVRVDSVAPIFEQQPEFAEEEEEETEAAAIDDADSSAEDSEGGGETSAEASSDGNRRRKRRRRRRGRERDGASEISADAPQPSDEGLATMARIGGDLLTMRDMPVAVLPLETLEEAPPADPAPEPDVAFDASPAEAGPTAAEDVAVEPIAEEAPRRRRSRRTPVRAEKEATPSVEASSTADPVEGAAPAPRRRRGPRSRPAETVAPQAETSDTGETEAVSAAQESRPSADRDVGADTIEHHAPLADAEAQSIFEAPSAPEDEAAAVQGQQAETEVATVDAEPSRPKRSGWWQRAKATFGS